jgi:hypothetical protein
VGSTGATCRTLDFVICIGLGIFLTTRARANRSTQVAPSTSSTGECFELALAARLLSQFATTMDLTPHQEAVLLELRKILATIGQM